MSAIGNAMGISQVPLAAAQRQSELGWQSQMAGWQNKNQLMTSLLTGVGSLAGSYLGYKGMTGFGKG
jgi:hypothetical protein